MQPVHNSKTIYVLRVKIKYHYHYHDFKNFWTMSMRFHRVLLPLKSYYRCVFILPSPLLPLPLPPV